MKTKWGILIGIVLLLTCLTVGLVYASGPNIERSNPEYVQSGVPFQVEITFTAPFDECNSIGISDSADGDISVVSYSPDGAFVKVTGGTIEIVWAEVLSQGEQVSVAYEVVLEGEPMEEFSFDGYIIYWDGEGSCTPGQPGSIFPIQEEEIREDIPETSMLIKPDRSYVLGAINQWLYGDSTMSEALAVVNAWVS